ncbi:gliding motility protein [Aggregicoccus sp. 17bor-14]|uniref:PD40 domain-containing protein n=1 Tax=Myxococcaceae TaxID=31 RepID=UPI00129CD519|nr:MULTISPECIES: PD40 domain-containing protein [Myxococcaceae]MBF5041232.1 PD40 domain-containing protein [Simulacricoccus sp. 17bor-14]MRI87018.1 gliding motility protein [Aggregicoccus sp. 17bor-14]
MAVRSVSVQVVVLSSVLVALGAGCKRGHEEAKAPAPAAPAAPGGAAAPEGTLLAAGNAQDLRLSPDRRWAVYLVQAKKPALDGIPPQMRLGSARVVSTAGGAEPRALGDGVSNVPGGMLFTPDSHYLLYLTGYSPAGQSGDLNVLALQDQDAAPQRVGRGVTYLLPSRDSKHLAFVEEGVLKVGALPAGPFQEVARDVATADFSPDGQWLLYTRRLTAGGGLEVVSTAKPTAPHKLGTQVGNFTVASDSKHVAFQVRSTDGSSLYDLYVAGFPELQPKRIAGGTHRFLFSPDGKWLARTENGKSPQESGSVVVGPASGAPGRTLGERVENITFSPDSRAVAFLARFVPPPEPGGVGTLTLAQLPDGEPKKLGFRVPNYRFSPDGKRLAFLSRVTKPVYSVDLFTYALGEEKAARAQSGVFGYGFSTKGESLVFRTNCIRQGRSCDLLEVPAEAAQAAAPQAGAAAADVGTTPAARKLADGIYTYELSEDGRRALVSYARMEANRFDLAVLNLESGKQRTLDQGVQLPAFFVGEDGGRVVYVVDHGQTPGVYAAGDVP